ncbi:MAG TPA: hypothetical protein VFN13_06570 [Rudaea sp.]|nr:hypothetical protein [Rudaea sp.]
MRMKISGLCLVLNFLFMGCAAHADVPMALDRASLSVGLFYPVVDANVSANGDDANGSDVDFRHDLGLYKHHTLSNLRLNFLIFDNQGFSVGGYRYSRGATSTLDRDIVFGGDTYHADADVDARLSLETLQATWHWWLAAGERDVVGIGLGAAYYDLRGTIDADVDVTNQTNTNIQSAGRDSAAGNAVAPLITLGWKHAFSERARLYADFSGVRKPRGAFTGHLLNGRIGFEYFPWENLGAALEYDATDLDVKANNTSWDGRAHIRFRGPSAFVRLRW